MESNNLLKSLKIGERIKSARKAQNKTQRDVARNLKIPFSTFSNYENGNRTPTYETLKDIASELGVQVEDLIGVKSSPLINEKEHEEQEERIESQQASFLPGFLTGNSELISYLKSIGISVGHTRNSLIFMNENLEIIGEVTGDELEAFKSGISNLVRKEVLK